MIFLRQRYIEIFLESLKNLEKSIETDFLYLVKIPVI